MTGAGPPGAAPAPWAAGAGSRAAPRAVAPPGPTGRSRNNVENYVTRVFVNFDFALTTVPKADWSGSGRSEQKLLQIGCFQSAPFALSFSRKHVLLSSLPARLCSRRVVGCGSAVDDVHRQFRAGIAHLCDSVRKMGVFLLVQEKAARSNHLHDDNLCYTL